MVCPAVVFFRAQTGIYIDDKKRRRSTSREQQEGATDGKRSRACFAAWRPLSGPWRRRACASRVSARATFLSGRGQMGVAFFFLPPHGRRRRGADHARRHHLRTKSLCAHPDRVRSAPLAPLLPLKFREPVRCLGGWGQERGKKRAASDERERAQTRRRGEDSRGARATAPCLCVLVSLFFFRCPSR